MTEEKPSRKAREILDNPQKKAPIVQNTSGISG